MKILGVAASQRNKLRTTESNKFLGILKRLKTEEQMVMFLNSSQEKEGNELTFHMSNTELMLGAALWGAMQKGAQAELVCLANYFGDRTLKNAHYEELTIKIQESDAVLLSSPVYFGDRSSLAQDFFRLVINEQIDMRNKVFSGLSVGAKRNGGQETCLIYSLTDFLNIGCLGVGNDTKTTSQYGGTGWAGEKGTIIQDQYGLQTALGTGRRIGEVLNIIEASKQNRLADKPKINILLLQDCDKRCYKLLTEQIFKSTLVDFADFRLFYVPDSFVKRCLGCNICPKVIGPDSEYRCRIDDYSDFLASHHNDILDADSFLIGGYSPKTEQPVQSIYQSFIERTRYIRRSDYILANRLFAPFVFKNLESTENFEGRIITSTIRHNTIMHKPVIFYEQDGSCINYDTAFATLHRFVYAAQCLTAGKIVTNAEKKSLSMYFPFGYTLSSQRDALPETIDQREALLNDRISKAKTQMKQRIVSQPSHWD